MVIVICRRSKSADGTIDRLVNLTSMPGFESCASLLQRKRFIKGNHLPCVQQPLEIGTADDLAIAQNSVAVQVPVELVLES